jgi:uncharacterized glyoxalase superfamily protein PhnB
MAPNIFPVLRYDDAPAAIDFLVRALGFVVASNHRMPDGRVVHADLRFASGGIGVSSTGTSPDGSPWADVRHGIYIVVEDPDAAYARAQSAGAEIALAIADQSYGSRDFTLRDPEGHLWGFGTYAMERGTAAPAIYPEMLYRDTQKGVDWIERALGFRCTLSVPGDDGSLKHAELRLGDGTVFVGAAPESEQFAGLTQFVNLRVDDPDTHFTRAKSGGAQIVMEPQTAPYGARFYAVRDVEGFLWWVSDYEPVAGVNP